MNTAEFIGRYASSWAGRSLVYVVICAAVLGGKCACTSCRPVAELNPMPFVEGVIEGNNSVRRDIGGALVEGLPFAIGKGVNGIRSSRYLSSDVELQGSGRQYRPGLISHMQQSSALEMRALSVRYNFYVQVGANILRRCFAGICDDKSSGHRGMHANRNAIFLGDQNPRPKVFPHYVELSAHDDELVDGGSHESTSEDREQPIGEGATTKKFFQAHRLFLFFVALITFCAGWICFVFGGYYFLVVNCRPLGFLFALALGVLSLFITLMFAHLSYF